MWLEQPFTKKWVGTQRLSADVILSRAFPDTLYCTCCFTQKVLSSATIPSEIPNEISRRRRVDVVGDRWSAVAGVAPDTRLSIKVSQLRRQLAWLKPWITSSKGRHLRWIFISHDGIWSRSLSSDMFHRAGGWTLDTFQIAGRQHRKQLLNWRSKS